MTRNEVIEQLAKEQRVEKIVSNITHGSTLVEVADLTQMIYLILLEYPEDKIMDLWENNQINFFIVRVIMTQWQSPRSPFNALYTRYKRRASEIKFDIADD